MRPGNPDFAKTGTGYAQDVRRRSQAKIEDAKTRIKKRVLATEKHGETLTIASVLREAGLNRLYLEGKNRKADKQALKDWLACARDRFQVPATEAPPSRKLEDRFEVLKGDFIRLQNAYYAAHLQHVDRAADLEEAEAEIRRLKAEIAELKRPAESRCIGS